MSNLSIQVEYGNDLIFVNKPAGIPTHAPDHQQLGLVELLQKQFDKKLYVVHRLDKTTTGCIAFATSEQKAQELFDLFKNHQVQKKYLFLTDRHVDFSQILVESSIEKNGKTFTNDPKAENPNAKTVFKRVKGNALFNLWEATPQTGKPHQIRLHAAQVGLPILGDILYGGSPYPHLCLHAWELEIPGQKKFTCSLPLFFERMGLIRDLKLAGILSALDRRQRLYQFLQNPQACLRLIHLDSQSDMFRMDMFGDQLWVYWYDDRDPTADDLERFEFVASLLKKKMLIRKMLNRGQDPLTQKDWIFGEISEHWEATENNLTYQLRTKQGLSPGLFLDQRKNREWVQSCAKDKAVLNLFSYTCGFSLAAAMGGAREVISVDLSAKFLEWGKENFKLNGLDITVDKNKFLFFAQDSLKFLVKTQKMQRQFDLIICDPPSFSRSEQGVFKIEKDYEDLIRACWSVLKPGGQLLFSSNFERWTYEDMKQRAQKALRLSDKKIRPGQQSLDFELPIEAPLMKSLILEKDES